MTFLLDTGSNKNYIRPDLVKNPKHNKTTFFARSANGRIRITQHTFLDFLGTDDVPLKFYPLPGFDSFDAILGNDSLKGLSAVIFTAENYFTIGNGERIRKINIKQRASQSVNNIDLRTDHLGQSQKVALMSIVERHSQLFADPDEKLTYSTVVVGDIRTVTETPVYAKSYPYPMALKDVVEEEINRLLREGIIRPSRSPYNSPVWIVPKKSDHSGKNKFRLVVDFRRLNSVTIADKYPIPEINEVLSNLGGILYRFGPQERFSPDSSQRKR